MLFFFILLLLIFIIFIIIKANIIQTYNNYLIKKIIIKFKNGLYTQYIFLLYLKNIIKLYENNKQSFIEYIFKK